VTRYTFGDSDAAGDRLELLADTFEPMSRAFIERAAPASPGLALDLGCGPGRTTRMLQAVTGAARTVGLDRSVGFVDRAGTSAEPGLSFVAHDLAEVPFPVGPADVMYARLLLAHLRDPMSFVARWSTMLTIGGRLLVDDVEAIETDDDDVRTYLDEVSVPAVRAGGGSLLVGEELRRAADPAGLVRVADDVVTVEPPIAVTARIFSMNLEVLVAGGEAEARPDIQAGLERAAASDHVVTWRFRQMAWERTS
jgi:SAM-dependent methyltransferase